MSKLSIRDQIIQADDIQIEQVPVPEWGVTIEVRGMNGAARARYMEMFRDEETGRINYPALYPTALIECCYIPDGMDGAGGKVFREGDEDIINQKSGKALERVAAVAMRLSGMNEDSEEKAGKDSSKESDASTSTSHSD